MADLEITGVFDSSQIVTGIQSASKAIQEGASEIVGSFAQIQTSETALSEAGIGGANLIEQLTGISSTVDEVSTSLSTLPQVASTSAEGLNTLEAGFSAAGEAASVFIEQVTGISGAVGIVEPQIATMDETLRELAMAQQEAAQTASILAEAEQSVIPATSEAADSILQQDEALAAMQDAQVAAIQTTETLAAAQAEAIATLNELAAALAEAADANSAFGEMQDAQVAAIEEATAAQAAATQQTLAWADAAATAEAAAMKQASATAEAATGAAQLGIQSNATSKAVLSLAEAMATLNNQSSAMSLSSQEQAAALELARNAAAKLGLQLVETAEGLKLVAITSDEVTASTTGMQSALAYATARLGAYETGLGAVGFALGTVGRASEVLAPILAAAFPIIGAIALIGIIDTLVEKFEKAQDEVTKTITTFDDLATSSYDVGNAIEMQNLKMEDQIAKLEGRPVENRLKEALLENIKAADDLNKKLEETIQKITQAIEGAHVSIFKALETGQEPTEAIAGIGNIYGNLEDDFRQYQTAIANKKALDSIYQHDKTEENRKAAEEAAQDVLNAHTKVNEELRNQSKQLAVDMKAEGSLISGATGLIGESYSKEALGKGVESVFSTRIAAINMTKAAVNELNDAEKEEGTTAEGAAAKGTEADDRLRLAKEQNAADARARDRIVSESQIKAEEDAARNTLTLAKSAADAKLKAQEAAIQVELQQSITAGEGRHEAEIAADEKLLAVRKEHYNALIAAQQAYANTSRALSEEQLDVTERTLVGPQKVAAETANVQKIKDIIERGNNEIKTLQNASNTEEVTTKAKVTAQIEAITEEGVQRTVAAKREEAREIISVTANRASEEQNAIKESTNVQMNVISTEESLHLISAQQGYQQRIALLQQEKQEFQNVTDARIQSLKQEQDQLQFLIQYYQELGATPEKIKPLVEEFDKLQDAINKADTAQRKLNDDIAGKALDAAIAKWKEQEQIISNFVTSSNNVFNGFVENVLTTTNTLKQDLDQAFQEIARAFVKMILDMIEQTALFKSVEGGIQRGISSIFGVATSAPTEVPLGAATSTTTGIATTGAAASTGAGQVASATTTSTQLLGIQQSLNAQLAVLYQQDVANYAAAQAQKTGQASISESAKTTATSAGETARAGIVTTGTTAQIGREATKVAAHTAGETTKTSVSATGEAKRQSLGLLGLAKHLAISIEKTVAHLLGETQRTAATTTSETAQTTAVTAGQTAQTAAVSTAQAAQSALVISTAAAETSAVIASNAARAESAIGTAAADVFQQAIESIPFPANLGAAPTLAWETYAQGAPFIAFAAAEKGALLGTDMPIFAHANEMILPSHLSTGLQQIISGGNTSNPITNNTSQTNFNLAYNAPGGGPAPGNMALDARHFADLLQKELRRRNIYPG